MSEKDNISLIIQRLSNNESVESKNQLDKILESNSSAVKDLNELGEVWNKTASYKQDVPFDMESALSKFKNKRKASNKITHNLKKEEIVKEAKVIKMSFARKAMSIAAFGAVLLGSIFLFKYMSSPTILTNSGAYAMEEILSDGSIVTLAPNSSLEISSRYNASNRDVVLTSGQAYFEIEENKDLPFNIDFNDCSIKVLGTVFNVKLGEKIQIDLISGHIEFHRESKVYPLVEGQQLIFNKESGKIEIENSLDPNSVHWISNQLSFNHTPIKKVLSDIENFYGVNINPVVKIPQDCHFTSPELTKVSISDLFEILEQTSGMKFNKISNQSYELVSLSCLN